MTYPNLEITVVDRSATVWLNRPDVRNALDETVIAELNDAFGWLGRDAGVRAVVLAGRGKAFCAGADLQWMKRMAGYSSGENETDALRLAGMLQTLFECPKPTIARVHGPAYAGGMGLAAACDIVVAQASAEFCLSEVKIGLVPATISPYVVQALGLRASRRYMLSAERMSATEAYRLGFAHEVCADGEIDAKIGELLSFLASAGPEAVAQTKRLIRRVAGQHLDTALMHETAELIAHVRASSEGQEGVNAFLEKRRPAWT
jgi:methylglutaconyl-CoA hydratase